MSIYTLPETHEAAERKWVEDNISKGGVFIDVGADTGTWTIPLSKHFDTVFAVEPSLDDIIKLQHSLTEKNINNVVVIDRAASSKEGKMLLAAGRDEPEWFPMEVGELPDGFTKFVWVVSMCLDSLNLSPKLIKIDVEGWGAEVLKGAIETLKRTDYLVLELHNASEIDFANTVLPHYFDIVHVSDSASIRYYRRKQ